MGNVPSWLSQLTPVSHSSRLWLCLRRVSVTLWLLVSSFSPCSLPRCPFVSGHRYVFLSEVLAALLLSRQVISLRNFHGSCKRHEREGLLGGCSRACVGGGPRLVRAGLSWSWHQGITITRQNLAEPSGRQGSAWHPDQTCLGKKLAAMRGWTRGLWATLRAKGGPDASEGP